MQTNMVVAGSMEGEGNRMELHDLGMCMQWPNPPLRHSILSGVAKGREPLGQAGHQGWGGVGRVSPLCKGHRGHKEVVEGGGHTQHPHPNEKSGCQRL